MTQSIYQGSNSPIRIYPTEMPTVVPSSARAVLVYSGGIVKTWTLLDMTQDVDHYILPLSQQDTYNLQPGAYTLELKLYDGENVILFEAATMRVVSRADKATLGDPVVDGDGDGIALTMSVITNLANVGGSGTTNHAALYNLDYEASRHTGFARAAQGALADTALQPDDIAAWAKSPVKPTYTAAEVSALPDSTPVFDGQYSSLSGAPEIPTATSQLTNDSGFITKIVSDLTEYYLKTETYTKAETDAKIAGIPKFRPVPVETLPAVGDEFTLYLVPNPDGENPDLKKEYIWIAEEARYEYLGSVGTIDLSNYLTIAQLQEQYYNKTQADARFEPVIGAKGTAFNKSFGTTVGSVCEGSRVLTPVPANAQFSAPYDDSDVVKTIGVGTTAVTPINNLATMPVVEFEFDLEDGSTETYVLVGYKKVVSP